MANLQTQIACAPFDAVADTYDDVFTFSQIGQSQRAAVWQELFRTFRPGDRILEIGCGTGVDACLLAGHGVKVVACDSSPAMIRVAAQRVRETGVSGVELRVLAAENLSAVRQDGPFDGVFSNFGALNCVEDLNGVAQNLGHLLKPGGQALLCFFGPCCLWEVFWYFFQGKPYKAFRRWRSAGSTAQLALGAKVQVRYHGVRALKRIFAPSLQLRSWNGIGLFVPPSYVEPVAKRFPALLRLAEWADFFCARCPGIRGLSDHVLLKLERVS